MSGSQFVLRRSGIRGGVHEGKDRRERGHCFFSALLRLIRSPFSVLRLSHFPVPGVFHKSFPVALELRRVGVGHRWRITVDADATELQGPWSAPELRPRLSSSSFLALSFFSSTSPFEKRVNSPPKSKSRDPTKPGGQRWPRASRATNPPTPDLEAPRRLRRLDTPRRMNTVTWR